MLEFGARVECCEDHFECALTCRAVPVDRDTAPVVAHRDRRAVRVQRELDVLGMFVHRFVDGVVDDFPDEVVKACRADATDVQSGALPNGIKSFENRYVFGGVGTSSHV